MPAPRHPLEEQVREVIANHPSWGPDRVHSHLRDQLEIVATKLGVRPERAVELLPSPRTIGRIKARFPEEDEHTYRYVRWPQSFDQGLLPWPSARLLLDEVAFWRGGFRKPMTVRQAHWFWRVRQSAPDAPVEALRAMSGTLAAAELVGGLEDKLRAAEGWLAFRAWQTDGDGLTVGEEAYERAVGAGHYLRWENSVSFYFDSEVAPLAYSELSGLSEDTARAILEQHRSPLPTVKHERDSVED